MSHGGGSGGHSGGHSGYGGDSSHSGHHGHSGGSHGDMTLASLLGIDTSGIAHALGFGGSHQGGHHASGNSHHSQEVQIPYLPVRNTGNAVIDRFLGFKLTSAFWLGLLFIGLVSWLILISFLRHHEPHANQIFGDANKSSSVVTSSPQEHDLVAKKQMEMQIYGRPDLSVSNSTAGTGIGISPNHPPVMWGIPIQSSYGPRVRVAVTR